MFNKDYIPAFWYSSNNFGDSLTHYLIKKITGKMPVLIDRSSDTEKFLVTGSILNNAVNNSVAWGCGVAFGNDKIYQHKKICAVRGRLTGELCKEQGIIFDEVYGDPALLLPKFIHKSLKEPKYKLGIIPHYVDTESLLYRLKCSPEMLEYNYGIKIIDILSDVETVVAEINNCEKVISSTLHGLITAHAYEIPARWVKFSDGLIGGDDFKYFDYYSTTDVKDVSFIDLRGDIGVHDLEKIVSLMPIDKVGFNIDIEELYNACPFK